MWKKSFYLAIIIWFLVGCGKDQDEVALPTSEIPVITGFYMSTIQGDINGVVGVPNCVNELNGYSMSHPYPNPARRISNVYIQYHNQTDHATLWLTPALLAGQELNTGASNNGVYMVAGGFPVFGLEITEPARSYNVTAPPGAYRIYVLCDKTLLYDNLIITE